MTEIVKKEQSALAMKDEQMEVIKKGMELVIPETDLNKKVQFAQNCMLYLVENKAEIRDGQVTIKSKDDKELFSFGVLDFLQKMWIAVKKGLSFGCKEFTLVPFGGKSPTIAVVPDFRIEKKRIEEKGISISFLHGKLGDEVFETANPLKHEFKLQKRPMTFKKIEGKGYSATTDNDVLWYACIAKNIETGEELSYVESRQNIELRANPASFQFYRNPNAIDSMYDKFVMRQLVKRLPSNWGGENWDRIEDIPFEDADYEEVAETNQQKPKTPPTQKLLPLVEGSETWFKMVESVKSHKVTIEQIARKYDIEPIRSQIETLFATYSESKSEDAEEESPLKLNI